MSSLVSASTVAGTVGQRVRRAGRAAPGFAAPQYAPPVALRGAVCCAVPPPHAAAQPGCVTFAPSGVGAASFRSSSSDQEPSGPFGFLNRWVRDGRRLREQLRALGTAGVVSYGLLNTAYYTCAFLFVWIYVAKVPPGNGVAASARRFVEVFGAVWAGSQVTKLGRAAGALMMAPLVDRALEWLQSALRLKTKRGAFLAVVAVCITFALLLFGLVVLLWS